MEELSGVRPLSAVLETDGSIEVEIAVPGQDEPQSMAIESSKATKLLVIPARRAIDLDEGDEVDALVRASSPSASALSRRRLPAGSRSRRAVSGDPRASTWHRVSE